MLVLSAILFVLAWTLSYFFLPEGVLRGRTGAGVVSESLKKRFGLYILVGLGFGAMFGIFLGEAIENAILEVPLGALGGVFVGWFVATAARENSKEKGNADGR